ncbi:unnamed protein product, partial [marine sediment metagenome]
GHFVQGVVGGAQAGFNMMQQRTEMKWKKDAIKKSKELEAKMEEAAGLIQKQFQVKYADGSYSAEDAQYMTAFVMAFGKDVFANHKEMLTYANQGNVDAYNKSVERQNTVLELIEGVDLNSVSGKELFEWGMDYVGTDEGRAVIQAQLKRSEALPKTPQAETFSSIQAVKEKYGAEAEAKYDASLDAYVHVPKAEPTELEGLQTQTATLDNLYILGEGVFNAYVKERGIDTTYDTYRQTAET